MKKSFGYILFSLVASSISSNCKYAVGFTINPTTTGKPLSPRPSIPSHTGSSTTATRAKALSAVSAKDQLLPLNGVVCVVTGGSRGIGKGIAVALGKEGATVYITGTSTSSSSSPSERSIFMKEAKYVSADGDPGTIEEAADAIKIAGGVGIPVVCNHGNDEEVKALFERVEKEQGRLDILVNNVFRIPPGGPKKLFGKFYEQSIEVWDTVHTIGLRSHYVASCYAMPLMIKSKDTTKLPRPFVAMISSFGALTYTFNVAYGVGKAAVDRLAKDMAVELGDDICVTSFWPGAVMTERTEVMLENGEWDKYVGLDLKNAETPEFTGRAICAVAKDDTNIKKSGTFQVVAELAEEYGFTDLDGSMPVSIRSLKYLVPEFGMTKEQRESFPIDLIPDWKLPFWIMAGGRPPDEGKEGEASAI